MVPSKKIILAAQCIPIGPSSWTPFIVLLFGESDMGG